jgi:DNA polymerase-3 subunit alpha
MAFVHLHRHSEFSRLDGVGSAKQYAERAAELGQHALAQTDHGTLSGALHHIVACRNPMDKGKRVREGDSIMPITGVEAYFRPNRANKITRKAWHLCLFAKNLKGWHNLLRIVSMAYQEIEDGGGHYQRPCVDYELLSRYHEGLIASSACFQSWLAQLIKDGDDVAVGSYIDTMRNLFGEDFWIEIMPHDFDDQRTLNLDLISIAQEHGIGLIATNDAHFPYKEWAETQRMAKIMGEQKTLEKVAKDVEAGKADYLAELTPTLYLAHEEEMRLWFEKHHPQIPPKVVDESIANTVLFTQGLTPFMLNQDLKLPKVTESPSHSEKILREWIEEGLGKIAARGVQDFSEYEKRVESEFAILKSKGVLDYFVMVGEVVRWCKEQGIRVGLGRGSAAGCLVSYCIGITAIDPIAYGLLFERFLNPERKGLPDIDLDFDSERRDEVKAFIASRYGQDHVADIITHATFQPRKVIQDLCRAFDLPYIEAHDLTDSIEIRQDDEETTLEQLLPINEKLQVFKTKYPHIWEHALRLEGSIANAGKHAAGIIITPKPIVEYMALERGKKGDLVTSWSDAADFSVISDYGFVKLDALGITGLSKHEYACKLIEERTGEKVDLNALPALYGSRLVDDEVMQGFRDGWTIGIFQFGGKGITNLLRDIQPDNILDLTAANALYRPGPMKGGVTWEYPKRKKNAFLRSFWHEIVKPILVETYGLIAYQEQVMEISKQIGGFSGAEADDLRKAMGKLYRIKGGRAAKDFMGQFESKWFEGAAERGIERKIADEIWHKMLEFGHYGFNKSHSASYALQAYQDMYLKVKYPAEFYAAFLTYEDDADKSKAALREARLRGIDVLLPDVNLSNEGYAVDDEGRLVLGLAAIKGVGNSAAQQIIKGRRYSSFDDFLQRAGSRVPHRELIESGALDSLADRAYLLSEVDKIGSKTKARWQVWEHLKHNMKLKTPREVPEDRVEPSPVDLARAQAQLLNMPVSSIQMREDHQSAIEENIWTPEEIEAVAKGTTDIVVGGEIAKVTKKKTKKGKPFANVTLVFGPHEWAVKFWETELLRNEDLLEEGTIIMVNGKKDDWQGNISVVARYVAPIEDFIADLEREETVASST